MLTTIAIVAIAAAAGLAILIAFAARRPDLFSIERSMIIDAPADRIFPLIADPQVMNSWNPFNEDPSIKGTYSGPARGPGARYTFESKRAGTGYTEVIEEHPPQQLVLRLVMTRPMACDNRIEFNLERAGGGTRVSWAMSGRVNFIGKVMGLVFDCDRMVGRQFEKGLASLKRLAERELETA